MRYVTITIEGTAPISFSRLHGEPKKDKELPDTYEKRTWREKAHVNDAGNATIPGVAIVAAVMTAAQRDSRKIPGKGHSTYSKHFASGLVPLESPELLDPKTGKPIPADKLDSWTGPMHANGNRTSGTRVMRTFPEARQWRVQTRIAVVDKVIPQELFREYLEQAGMTIGLGRWRPENRGMYGRFRVVETKWEGE